jgi:hypothetical protein
MINYVEDEDSFEKDILSIFDSKLDKDVPGEEFFEGNLSQNNQSLIENDNQKKGIDISGILSNSFSKFRMDVSSEDFFERNLPQNNINENDVPNLANIEQNNNEKIGQSEDMVPKNNMISKKRKKTKTIFKTKEIKKGQINYEYKLGNYIIRCITAVNQFIIKKINKKIEKNTSLKGMKLHTPSYESFSEKLIIKKNRNKYLNTTMKNILKEKEIKKQKENSTIIELIEKENDEELIQLLNIKYKDVIEKFYDSNDFEIFKFNREIQFYDQMFKRRHKSIFEKYGLIDFLEKN